MKSNIKGFTLIEIIVVIVITGIIGSMAASLLYQGSDMYVNETSRQDLVNESRSSFWRLMRNAQGQISSSEFISSDQNKIILKDAKEDSAIYEIISNGDFKISTDGGLTEHVLSNSVSYSLTNGFSYLDSSFNEISIGNSGISSLNAESIHLPKFDFVFVKHGDTVSYKSYVYPINFRFGNKMSYHN